MTAPCVFFSESMVRLERQCPAVRLKSGRPVPVDAEPCGPRLAVGRGRRRRRATPLKTYLELILWTLVVCAGCFGWHFVVWARHALAG